MNGNPIEDDPFTVFVESLDFNDPTKNTVDLITELGLTSRTHLSVEEGVEQIARRVTAFTTHDKEYQVGFNYPGTSQVAVLLYKLAELQGMDRFVMTTGLLQVVRWYFGGEVIKRCLTEQHVYDDPLRSLLLSGNHEVSVTRV